MREEAAVRLGHRFFGQALRCALALSGALTIACDDGPAGNDDLDLRADGGAEVGSRVDTGPQLDAGLDAELSLDAAGPDAAGPDAAGRDGGRADAHPIDALAADGDREASDVEMDGGRSDGVAADEGTEPDLGVDADLEPGPRPAVIRGRFESAAPIRNCGQIVNWQAPDGLLLRPTFSTCGDDMVALANTIVANLDAAHARGGRAMLVIGQGLFLPESWLQNCQTFDLNSGNFVGTSCKPWDVDYQARLRAALVDVIGPAVQGHPGLAGVYFTISSMTNGSELHFRTERSTLAPYPGDDVMRQAYLDVMDIYQTAFEVPVVFEAGHCIWMDLPGGEAEVEDCATPLALYRHAHDTYGAARVGLALWNCAERFFAYAGAIADGTRPLLEEATRDGVSLGCQTVGAFEQSCRFTDDQVADYGTPPAQGQPGGVCPEPETNDPEAACVDTMNWFAGVSSKSPDSVALRGTWSEVWSQDHAPAGIYQNSVKCREAVDLTAPAP